MSTNPSSHRNLPRQGESSDLRSPRDSDDVSKGWAKVKELRSEVASMASSMQEMQRQIYRLRRRQGGGDSVTGDSLPVWL